LAQKGTALSAYELPTVLEPETVGEAEVVLVASGDLRVAANQTCWPAQARLEGALADAFARFGTTIRRAHEFDPVEGHGFISSQRMGMEVFRRIDPDCRLVVAEAVWQYSHHVLAGLRSHRGPILTVANWEGQWPGLVGLLNLNASLTKAGREYSTIWSKDFTDEFFLEGLEEWLEHGQITHDRSHVVPLDPSQIPMPEAELGRALAGQLRYEKAILGVFDEGCMGMYNAIIDDEYLNPLGVYKERLSQSALLAEMSQVGQEEVDATWSWLRDRGMRFELGDDPATELTEAQVRRQLEMYIAATRIADRFGCDAIGIQYQQGLKDMAPASDLAEGLLNNVDRPPVQREDGSVILDGAALPHFNEVDEGVAIDLVVTNRIWRWLGFDPASTLHDIRWGERYQQGEFDEFVWVFEISGSVPPSHLRQGYAGAVSERQPPMYFPLGGGTIKGVSKPGEIVWSRFYLQDARLQVDLGRATVVELPEEETLRRWRTTTPQWPIMHAVLHGVSRDQMMAQHRANHINVAYAPDAQAADRALAVKASMCDALGVRVNLCGDVSLAPA
jgi:hypothetical protein